MPPASRGHCKKANLQESVPAISTSSSVPLQQQQTQPKPARFKLKFSRPRQNSSHDAATRSQAQSKKDSWPFLLPCLTMKENFIHLQLLMGTQHTSLVDIEHLGYDVGRSRSLQLAVTPLPLQLDAHTPAVPVPQPPSSLIENTAEDLHENIVNQANPQALEAHRIGNTTSIVILFAGTKVPNYIKYGSIIVKCGLYRQHHNVCKTCSKIGHRADVCPTPETKICFACGAPNPTADHAARCKPRCKLCNGAHATGTEGCTNKYKVPFVVTQRRWERRNAASAFSSQDFPQLPPQQQNEAHLSKRGRSRSRKRDKSRRQSASRGRSTDGKRSENMNYNRNQQRPGNVINGAQAINPQAANRNPLNHVAEAKDNTIQSLRNENEQLK
ncbi:hypothetical protein HPB51_025743 [Rhipicephalus microplus]|uniref:CCHC-type domain-containing protein n=1 Tax=Rhipicephalus microplus TaxID=6941 RepID=A0A9J6F8R0_RHIMP|nr:hypothetical protein HPB51_025743 [Rhipicephalus microplus]